MVAKLSRQRKGKVTLVFHRKYRVWVATGLIPLAFTDLSCPLYSLNVGVRDLGFV